MCESLEFFDPDELSCTGANDSDYSEHEEALKFWRNFLIRTILDWYNYRGRRKPELRRIWDSADEWLFHPTEEDAGYLTSFHATCVIVGRDPHVVQTCLRTMSRDEFMRRYSSAGKS